MDVTLLNTKVLFLIILLSILFVGANTAFHGSDLSCDKCHTMHASSDGDLPTMPDEPSGTPEGPNAHLLYKANTTDLCLVCHDGQTNIPDVVGVNVNDIGENEPRAGGRFGGGSGVGNLNGHNLGAALDMSNGGCETCHFGGQFSTAEVGCTNCHDAHGSTIDYDYDASNYSYRNLQWASDPVNSPQIRAYVDVGVNPPVLDHYMASKVAYPAPSVQSSPWREVSNICLDCHHTFSGDEYTRDSNGKCIRHPNTDSERDDWANIDIGELTGVTDPTHWFDGVGVGFSMARVPFIVPGAIDYAEATAVVNLPGGGNTNEVFCLTCHKAHGTEYEFGLRWDYKGGDMEGCQQCHNTGY